MNPDSTTKASAAKLSVIIPCYNQPDLLKRCLSSLREQTFKDFSILIIDDLSSIDYTDVLGKFKELDINYIKNIHNLGAIKNIFHSITIPVSTPYKISIHEDDVLHPDYLRVAVDVLEKEPNTVFIGCPIEWFRNEAELEIKKVNAPEKISDIHRTVDRKGFVMNMLEGLHFGLGSVVYRSAATLNSAPDFQKFSVQCDRPYLVSLMNGKQNMCVILERSGLFGRNHGKNDNRGDDITYQNIFNLMEFYKKFMRGKEEMALFYRHSTNNIIYSYHRLIREDLSFVEYLKGAKEAGLLRFSYLDLQGILGLYKGFMKK